MLARYSSDQHGTLPPALLIPRVDGERRRRRILVSASEQRDVPLDFVVEEARAPRLFSSDRLGRLQTELEEGDKTAGVTLRNFERGCVRVYVVPLGRDDRQDVRAPRARQRGVSARAA
jgi:hypothetical protein